MYIADENNWIPYFRDVIYPETISCRSPELLLVEPHQNLYVEVFDPKPLMDIKAEDGSTGEALEELEEEIAVVEEFKPKGTIILVHGFTESVKKYYELIHLFLKEGYRVVGYDQCGHGRSYRMNPNPEMVHIDTFQRYIWDLDAVVRKVRSQFDGPVYLFGHSLGGAVCLHEALTHHGKFAGVILCAPMIEPLTGPVPAGSAAALARAAIKTPLKNTWGPGQKPYKPQSFVNAANTSRARFELYNQLQQADPSLQTSGGSWNWMYEAVAQRNSLQKKLNRPLDCPLLILEAGKDAYVSNKAIDETAARLKAKTGVKLVKFPEAKHEIYGSEAKILKEMMRQIFSFLDACQQ